MEKVLDSLNFQMRKEIRNVILFLDNATVHPTSLIYMYSNIKTVFLPKIAMSRLQSLDAGIIQSFKTKQRKKLCYVTARKMKTYLLQRLQKPLTFFKLSYGWQLLGRRLALK